MELSPTRELKLEGWTGSEITHISVLFEDLFQNLKKGAPDIVFYICSAKRDPQEHPRVPQIHQKSSKNGVQNSLGFPLAAGSLPERIQGSKRYPKVIEHRWFWGRFSVEIQWQIALKMWISGSWWAMLWHKLLSLVFLWSRLYCIFCFLAWELSCLVFYPLVSQESGVYIARRFPVPLPLQVPTMFAIA